MANMTKKFTLEVGWRGILEALGLNAQDLLRHADLPRDLFTRARPELTEDEHFRLWESAAALLDDPLFPLKLGQSISAESFSPPLFAAFCSPDLSTAVERLARYKPLIGPMVLHRSDDRDGLSVGCGHTGGRPLPPSVAGMELVFLVHMARLATRHRVVPLRVEFANLPDGPEHYSDFFGVPVEAGPANKLTFSPEDAKRPFLSVNDGMFSIFEPVLAARLEDLEREASFRDRVRACLVEALPGGRGSMADIARKLAVSTRTMQRRLAEEGSSFQEELNELRAELARHYLTRSDYSSAEISFLLGYNDPNSFIRAVHAWTGQTPQMIRGGAGLH
jgi:AraC-like DNA-binding protein